MRQNEAMMTRRGTEVHLIKPGMNITVCRRQLNRRFKTTTLAYMTTCMHCRHHRDYINAVRRPIETDETEHGEKNRRDRTRGEKPMRLIGIAYQCGRITQRILFRFDRLRKLILGHAFFTVAHYDDDGIRRVVRVYDDEIFDMVKSCTKRVRND